MLSPFSDCPRARYGMLQPKTKGWRFGVLMCAASVLMVFIINLSTTVWSVSHFGFGGREATQTLYEGDCSTAGKLNTGLHLLINGFSTILLSSSNYCMQCLSAPTRKELDKAHSKGKWLDIGVMSTRNLRGIATKRVVLWWLLCISSLPLHLFYNSAVFQSISYNDYMPLIVTTGFLSDPSNNYTGYHEDEAPRLKKLYSTGGLERLDNLKCINQYAKEFQTSGSVLLVTENSTSAVYSVKWRQDGRWVCDEDFVSCEISPKTASLRADPSSWNPGDGERIAYCLSERLQGRCRVQSSLILAVVVISLNLAKAIIMLSLVISVKESPLMTIGDAVASYLWRPDPSTENMCFASKEDIKRSRTSWPKEAKTFRQKQLRLFAAASKTRWAICISMFFAVLGTAAYLLFNGLSRLEGYYSSTFSLIRLLGVGRAFSLTQIGLVGVPMVGPAALIANVVIANAGQPLLSFVYFSYNGLFTSVSAALEWETYARQRKGLRVSQAPHGEQRSTYFLQLPYRIALPLMVASGFLHWLVSQSIFLINIQAYAYDSELGKWTGGEDNGTLTCGYSPLAIILTLSTGVLLIIILFITAMMRFRTATPVVASCSAAIAAACHAAEGEEEENACISKVQWGVTSHGLDGVGHCAFSARPVSTPRDGSLYRGKK